MKEFFLKIAIVFIFNLISINSFEQAIISGNIKDKNTNIPLAGAYVLLQRTGIGTTNMQKAGDSLGYFEFKHLPEGNYKLQIKLVGYITFIKDNIVVGSDKVNLGNVFLSQDTALLGNVTVTTKKPIVVNTPEKIIFNAANDVSSQGGAALNVLKKVPQVDVDIDGNVELQGNPNIRFLINGKPSSAFGNSLTDALGSIPASDIQQIEVMTAPGAQYDAQGSGGVINIILKESRVKGFNGNLSLASGTRLQNGSLGLNYRNNNISLHAFFNGNAQLRSHTPFTQTRHSYDTSSQTTTDLTQKGYGNFVRNGYQTGIGMDWDVSKYDNINVSFGLNHLYSRTKDNTDISQTIDEQLTQSLRNSLSRNSSNIYEWSLGYTKKFKKEDESFSVLYNASYGSLKGYSELSQTITGESNPYIGSIVSNPGTDHQNFLSFDYKNPLAEKLTLETGLKGSWQNITSNSDISFYKPASTTYVNDSSQSYDMRYRMDIYAAYVAANYKISDKWALHAGLRYEYTYRKMDYNNLHLNAYGNLSPSAILSFKINDMQSFRLAYTRRIERPEYQELNPYLNISDPYNMSTGNPLLQPEIGNNFELGYSNDLGGKGNLYVAAMERINTQDVKPYTTFYANYTFGDSIYQNVSISNRMNIGTEYNTGAIITSSINFGKFNLRENAMLFVRHMINNYDGGMVTNAFNWRINGNASYQFASTFVGEGFINYRSGFKSIQGQVPKQLTYTIAFRKQFWNKNASIGITATNPFNKYVNQLTTVNTSDYNSSYLRQVPYRSFGINFTYKFGKLNFNKKKEEENYINSAPDMEN